MNINKTLRAVAVAALVSGGVCAAGAPAQARVLEASTAEMQATNVGTLNLFPSSYRAYDSRDENVKLTSGTSLKMDVSTLTDGTTKMLPANAKGIVVNLTVAGVDRGGWVHIGSGDMTTMPTSSTLNPTTGVPAVANGTTVMIPTSGQFAGFATVTGGGGINASVIIDVLGYYS